MLDIINIALHGAMVSIPLFLAWETLYSTRDDSDTPIRVRFLASIFFFFMAIGWAFWFITYIYADEYPLINYPEVLFDFISVPIYVLTLMEIIRYKNITAITFLEHTFIPILLVVAVAIFPNDGLMLMGFSYYFVYIWYSFNSIKRSYKRYNEEIHNIYSDVEGRQVDWTKKFVLLFFIGLILYIILEIFVYNIFTEMAYGIAITMLAIYVWRNISKMRNNSLVNIAESDSSSETVMERLMEELREKSKNSHDEENGNSPLFVIDQADKDIFIEKLKVIETEKLYRNPNFNRDEAIRVTGLNRTTFSINLKAITGMSFSTYIRELRIKHACYLLENTEYTGDAISVEVGFNSVQNFHRVFKTVKDMTPAEYRERLKSGE